MQTRLLRPSGVKCHPKATWPVSDKVRSHARICLTPKYGLILIGYTSANGQWLYRTSQTSGETCWLQRPRSHMEHQRRLASFRCPHSWGRRNRECHELMHQACRYSPCSPSSTLAGISDSSLWPEEATWEAPTLWPCLQTSLSLVPNRSCWSTSPIPLSPVTHPLWLLQPPRLSPLPYTLGFCCLSPAPKLPCPTSRA